MHVVAIGDIGPVDDMIHIGDEAMFEVAVRRLRERGVDRITAISSNPADSAARYDVDAVLPLGRGGSPDELRTAIAASDGVLVAGAGNISSVWPSHIVERAGLAHVAAELGRPFVVTGQTIGPALTPADRDTVARMLGTARLVGTRESASAALVAALGVDATRAQQNVDDASFLADGVDASHPGRSAPPYALVTLARHVGEVDSDPALAAYAGLLDAVAEQTGLEVVFHAHFASLRSGESRGDSAVHDAVASRMRTPHRRVAPTTDAAASARLARAAGLVVTSRYHPAVFAGPAGVPTIGIPVDGYTDVKLRGALGGFGQDGILELARLLEGAGPETVQSVWGARAATRERGIRLAQTARTTSAAWWDRVRAAFDGD